LRRLVYGGHTIGLAQASLARLLPSMAHVIGWHSCDHVGPVFEGDVLAFASELTAVQPLGSGRLLAFRVLVDAEREGLDEPARVLDWQPVVYAA
jgi:acyl dehydratase